MWKGYNRKFKTAPKKKLIHPPRTEPGTKNELALVEYKEIIPNFKIKTIHPPKNVSFPLKRGVLFEKIEIINNHYINNNILVPGSEIYLISPHDLSVLKMTISEFNQYSVSGANNLFLFDNKSGNTVRIVNYGIMVNFIDPKYVFSSYKKEVRLSYYLAYSEKQAIENICKIYIPNKIIKERKIPNKIIKERKIPNNINTKSASEIPKKVEKLKKLKKNLEKYLLSL